MFKRGNLRYLRKQLRLNINESNDEPLIINVFLTDLPTLPTFLPYRDWKFMTNKRYLRYLLEKLCEIYRDFETVGRWIEAVPRMDRFRWNIDTKRLISGTRGLVKAGKAVFHFHFTLTLLPRYRCWISRRKSFHT